MTEDEKVALLRQAIREARPVSGMGMGLRREFCPHFLGTKGSRTMTAAGMSWPGSSTVPPGQACRLAADQSCIDRIDCAVDPSCAAPGSDG
ncbi:hypothetical protein ACFOGJ_11360 [Marinibaculum pumilum]|uniref:Uncharacterized protein n=1 Tax=Marinibaculum pumilum TaxID=1766165 RepID=A0ABV7KZI5_9PROT